MISNRKIEASDSIFIGSPIYFGGVTAQTKLFTDRLFPYVTYKDYSSLLPEKKQVGLFYTMNMNTPEVYTPLLDMNERMFSLIFGTAETTRVGIQPFDRMTSIHNVNGGC